MRKILIYDKVEDFCLDLVSKGYTIKQIENALSPIEHILSNGVKYQLLENCRKSIEIKQAYDNFDPNQYNQIYNRLENYCFGLVNENYNIQQIEELLVQELLYFSRHYKLKDALLESCKKQIKAKWQKENPNKLSLVESVNDFINIPPATKGVELYHFERKFPDFVLEDALERKFYPKPAYLEDENLHPSVKNFFEAMYAKLPEYPFHLNPPCTDEALALLEQHFENPMPKAFKDFYKITDGFCMSVTEEFISVMAILKESVEFQDNSFERDEFSPYKEIVQPYYYHKNWLIFTNPMDSGDFFAIDFVPAEKGTWGQIIEGGADFFYGEFVCQNFETILDKITEKVLKSDLFIATLTYNFTYENRFCFLCKSDWTLDWKNSDCDLYYLNSILHS